MRGAVQTERSGSEQEQEAHVWQSVRDKLGRRTAQRQRDLNTTATTRLTIETKLKLRQALNLDQSHNIKLLKKT